MPPLILAMRLPGPASDPQSRLDTFFLRPLSEGRAVGPLLGRRPPEVLLPALTGRGRSAGKRLSFSYTSVAGWTAGVPPLQVAMV